MATRGLDTPCSTAIDGCSGTGCNLAGTCYAAGMSTAKLVLLAAGVAAISLVVGLLIGAGLVGLWGL
jgi:hypothetical protein